MGRKTLTEDNTRAVGYCRVSSKEQEQGFSLDSQQRLMEDYAFNNGFQINELIRISESASKGFERKMFLKTFEYCRANNVRNIFVEKIDRLTRNPKDAGFADDWVREHPENRIHFIKENFIASQAAKAHENLVWNMKVSIARFYTQNLSEEVMKGNQEKVRQGLYHGSNKYGYLCVGQQGRKVFVIDQEKAPIMRKLFENYASASFSMNKLRDWAWDNGLRSRTGRKLTKSKIEQILKDPFYYGSFMYNGTLYKGSHEPLITKDLFDQITHVRTKGKASALVKHSHLFEKMIYCKQCGGTYSSEKQKGHVYCYCKHHKDGCNQKGGLREDSVKTKLTDVFGMFTEMPESDIEEIRTRIKENHREEAEYKEKTLNALNTHYMSIQGKIERIYDDKISGLITTDFWQRKYDDLTLEQKGIQDQITKLKSAESQYFELYINILDLAVRAKDIFNSKHRTNEEKRELLSLLFDGISIIDRKVDYTLKEPVRKYQESLKVSRKILEPKKPLQTATVSQFWDKDEIVLADRDSNPDRWHQKP
jgi:site-specific DNA recombinase